MAQTKVKKGQYKILNRQDLGLSVAITFKAHERELPPWTIFIRKKEWTPEVEKTRILKHIKKLKKELKKMRNMHNVELTETELNVLWSLAKDGPSSSKYELLRKRKVAAHTTGGQALKSLESRGLIKIGRPEGGRKRMSCELTTFGMFAIIASESEDVFKRIDRIVEKNKSKVPFVFSYWEDFVKNGNVNDFWYNTIQYFYPPYINLSVFRVLQDYKPTEETDQFLADDLTRYVVLPWLCPIVYELYLPGLFEYLTGFSSSRPTGKWNKMWIENWMKIIFRYKALREYLLKELGRLENWCEKMSRSVEQWKSIVQKLEMAQKVEDKARA